MIYPITTDYIPSWGLWECVREILQNAIDTEDYEVYYHPDTLTVSNKGSFSKRMLLLGATDKGNGLRPEAIGQFGEGLKLAMLVAARNKRRMVVTSGEFEYIPRIIRSKKFDTEVLDLKIRQVTDTDDSKTFITLDMRRHEWEAIYGNKWLDGEDFGKIVGMEPGSIYVNGLFITKYQGLEHSYNFKPSQLELNRDRDIPSMFSVQLAASEVLSGEEIIEAAIKGSNDVSPYAVMSAKREAIADTWVEKYGIDCVPVGISEQDKIKAENKCIVPDWLAEIIRSIRNFFFDSGLSPLEKLERWYDDNHHILNQVKAAELRNIIMEIKGNKD